MDSPTSSNSPQKLLFVLSLIVVILCGGYALHVIDWMESKYSLGLLVIEGIFAASIFYSRCQRDPGGKDTFAKAMDSRRMKLVLFFTIVISCLNLFWPKTSAGIGAGIIFLIYALYFLFNREGAKSLL